MKPKIKLGLQIILLALILIIPSVSHASLLICGGSGQSSCTLIDILSQVAKITNWLMGLAGIYAVFNIVVSGFQMVIYSGSEGEVKKAKSGLENAIIGFLIVLIAYAAINTIYMVFNAKVSPDSNISFPFNPFKS